MSVVFVLDGYCNRIREKSERDWLKRVPYHSRDRAFATYREAADALIDRAEKQVEEAKKSLWRENMRLKEARRRFSAELLQTSYAKDSLCTTSRLQTKEPNCANSPIFQ